MTALFSHLVYAFGGFGRLKIFGCLLISYPLGSVFIRIPSSRPSLKHAFNIFISVLFLIPVLNLQWGFFQLLANALAIYFFISNFRGPNMPWIVFIFAMAHLTINHVIREVWLSREAVEITHAQMMLTMKLTAFAWNVYDGRRPKEDLDKWQLQKRVTQYPTLLEFLGFSFFFPGVLYGPNLDYVSYKSLIDETLFRSAESRKPARRAIPDGRKRVGYRKMLQGLVFMGLFVALFPSYNFTVALTPWFAEQTLLYRIAIFQLYGFVERCKFYAIWTLTEGACILTGLGFTGFGPSGESRWEGMVNIKSWKIELPSNFKVIGDNWNINTNIWLRECVYKRVTPKGSKPGLRSILITGATSAFWHGIAIGYYLTFIPMGIVTYLSRKCRDGFRPLVVPLSGTTPTWMKRIYDCLGTVVSLLLLNFASAPFRLLTLVDTIEAWSRLGWYGWWIVGFGIVFFNAGGSTYLRSLQRQQTYALGVKKPKTPGPLPDVAGGPLKPAVEKMKTRINQPSWSIYVY